MKPIIKYNDTFLKIISPFMSIGGITLFPFIILKERYLKFRFSKRAKIVINHELIHIEQQKELLVIPFYVLYFLEWFIKLFIYGSDSYRNISFEREAYKFEEDLNYLPKRNRYSFIKYILKNEKRR